MIFFVFLLLLLLSVSFSKLGIEVVANCITIDALIYGTIPSAKIPIDANPPPEKTLRKLTIGLVAYFDKKHRGQHQELE